jgi:hypothetical protein
MRNLATKDVSERGRSSLLSFAASRTRAVTLSLSTISLANKAGARPSVRGVKNDIRSLTAT